MVRFPGNLDPKAPSGRRPSTILAACLLSFLLALPVLPARGAELPIPELARWEANMLSFGQTHCDYYLQSHTFDEFLNHTYYDGERVYYQIAGYTGNSSWNTCAQRAEAVYRDQYVIPNNGGVPGFWNFTTGLRMDFQRTGDVTSKNAAILLSKNAAYCPDARPLDRTASADLRPLPRCRCSLERRGTRLTYRIG